MTMTIPANAPAPAGAETISLYEAIGGQAAVAAAVDVFYRWVLADPELSLFFPGGVGARHRASLPRSSVRLGGPRRYRGPGIAAAHRGLGITDVHFDRVAAHLAATLDELAVPRHLADRIVGIVAGLRSAVVTA